jgi:hypothetical protein
MTGEQAERALRPWAGLVRRQEVLWASDKELGQQRQAMEKRVGPLLQGIGQGDRELLLAEVRDGYEEQDRRVERTERRATTLLGAVTVITTVIGATGAILSSTDVLDDAAARYVFAAAVFVVVGFFGAAAWWALRVITIQDTWRRPNTYPSLEHRCRLSGTEMYVHSVAALMDSIDWNRHIAQNKARRLRNASKAFGKGLTTLVVVALAFTLLSAVAPAGGDRSDAAPRSSAR